MKSSISSQTLTNEASYHQQHLKEAVSLAIQQDTDMVIVSKEKTLIFCHSSLLALFSPLIARLLAGVPCCSSPWRTVFLPDFPTLSIQKLIHLLKFGQAIPGRNVNADIGMINKIANVLEISIIDINLGPFLDNPLDVPFEVKKELNGFVIKEEVNSIKEEKTENCEYIEKEITEDIIKLENVGTDQELPDINDNEWMVEDEIKAQGKSTFDVEDATVGTTVQVDTYKEKGNNESLKQNIRIKRPACVLGSTESFSKKLRTSLNLEIGDSLLNEKQVEAPVAIEAATPVPVPTKAATPVPLPTKAATPVPLPTKAAMPVPLPTKAATPVPLPTKATTPVPLPTKATTPVPLPTKIATPVPLPKRAATPVPLPTKVATPAPLPTKATTPVPLPTKVATPVPLPTKVATSVPLPKRAATPDPLTVLPSTKTSNQIIRMGEQVIQKVVIKQKSIKPGHPGSQFTVPLQTLQALQAGQGIPTGQPGHLLVKTETGQYQILRVGPSNTLPTPPRCQAACPAPPPVSALGTMGGSNATPRAPGTTPAPPQVSIQNIKVKASSKDLPGTKPSTITTPTGLEETDGFQAKLLECELCTEKFHWEEFVQHTDLSHTIPCDLQLDPESNNAPHLWFVSDNDLAWHIHREHDGPKPDCQKIKEDKNSHESDLDQYTRFSDDRKFESVTCCICGLEFKEVEQFRKHSRKLHPFACSQEDCRKRFTTHKNLHGHLDKDHSVLRFSEDILFHRGWLGKMECNGEGHNQTGGNQERRQH